MRKTDANALVRLGGRYFRDPQTGALLSEAEHLKQQQKTIENTEAPVASPLAKRKGS